ncbi:MAG: T9SS type B sorting domain-containing protein [Bacteroidota bacterium]
MSKIKLGCLILLGLFSFSGNLYDTTCNTVIEKNLVMNPVVFEVCDDDGFAEIDISSVENLVLQAYDGGNGNIEEEVVISTSFGHVIKLGNLSSGTVTTQIICDAPSAPFSDIAVDENSVIYVTDFSSIRVLDETNCSTAVVPGIGSISAVNSLSFDTQGNLYFGGGNNSNVFRFDSDEMTPPYVWHNFGSGAPSGDFVVLGDKMYISWSIGGSVRLYEVTIDAAFNYVSHVDLGTILNDTFGLASELGQLYGVTTSELYRIDLDTFTFTTIATNNFANGSWFGAAGLHEAFGFVASTHINQADANSNSNPLPDAWNNTQQGAQTVYVRVENIVTGVVEVVEVNIVVGITPTLTAPSELFACNDGNTNTDFDLTEVETELLQNVTNSVTTTYYTSENDALEATNAINSNYTTTQTQETIYVRVQNVADNCFATSQFTITANASPSIVTPADVMQCEVQNNGIVDLTQVEAELLQNNTIAVNTTYHANLADATTGTNTIAPNYQATLGQQTIYVRVESAINPDCFETTQFGITLSENPIIVTPSDIVQCEDENNGFFDLTLVETELLQNNTLPVTLSYYTTLADASIAVNAISTNYQIPVGQFPIFVRVNSTVDTGCFEIASFSIIRSEDLQLTVPNNLTQCENENNGIFDLTQVETEVLQNVTSSVTVTYHTSQANASTGTNPIGDSYQITTGQETIFVRVEINANDNCFATTQFDIIQGESPNLTTPTDLVQCPEDNNGLFELTQVETELLQNVTETVDVSYHTTETDANANTNPLDTNYNPPSNQEIVFVRVANTISNCFSVAQFQVITQDSLSITSPSNLTRCANENSLVFDLTEVEAELLQDVTQTVVVSYHASADDANDNVNALATNYTLTTPPTTIFVRVEDVATNCFETTQFAIEILAIPSVQPMVNSPSTRLLTDCAIDADSNGFFDLNDAYPLIISGNTSYAVEFFLSEADAEQEINTIDPIFYAVNSVQEIFVTVTNDNGCKSITNFFVDPACYDTVVDITNISFPGFFTPNNDTANDTWNVQGISSRVQQTSIMYIFDRYGKLLFYFRPGQIQGWDGMYQGRLMPSSDYWYKFETAEGRTFTGSFSLIR